MSHMWNTIFTMGGGVLEERSFIKRISTISLKTISKEISIEVSYSWTFALQMKYAIISNDSKSKDNWRIDIATYLLFFLYPLSTISYRMI